MSNPTHPLLTALSAALADAADLLGAPAEQIDVEHVDAVDWPDSCLGLPAEGEECAEALVPGYRIVLGDGFVYRADRLGNARRVRRDSTSADDELRLSYTVTGGIAGRTSTFETDGARLSEAEERELRRLVDEADFFAVPNVEPARIITDGFTRRLRISIGRRSHEVVRGDGIDAPDTDAFTALVAWAEERLPPLFPHGAVDAS